MKQKSFILSETDFQDTREERCDLRDKTTTLWLSKTLQQAVGLTGLGESHWKLQSDELSYGKPH